MTTIWWVRRDLRLSDNQALRAALANSDNVLPVFVLDPDLLGSKYVGQKRLGFLFAGLHALRKELRERGSDLIVCAGRPLSVLQSLVAETNAQGVYAEFDVSPYARRRDARLAEVVPLELTDGLTVHAPELVHKASGEPYTVYTPYSRMWKSLPFPDHEDLLVPPARMPLPPGVRPDAWSVPIPEMPSLPQTVPFEVGETAALRYLETFQRDLIGGYNTARDRMDLDVTSHLSPYIRFGMVSARRLVVTALASRAAAETDEARRGATTWLNELIWREFYISILYHFPFVRRMSFREQYREILWRNEPDDYAAWKSGHTGYPVVDAAMRQLLATGWMHNRARMIVASFLTKDLLIDWRWGEQHFMQHLIDGDPASNNGGWQWTAGTGTDAAPYFRIFNPVLQSKKYDPDGDYIRRWVPELRSVSTAHIHEPWKMPLSEQQRTGCVIGDDYPAPIVDHRAARERTLTAYKEARERYGQ